MLRYETLTDIRSSALQRFDLIIDARSPGEFAEDHLPGAVNLPVLNDAERAQIGTMYVQDSAFTARRAGAALVAQNVAHHLHTSLADQPRKFRPLVYCWRGGMRSNAFATILAAVGWPVAVLEGGYRTWRRAVVSGLDAMCPRLNLILVDGQTGTAKTALLAHLKAQGAQVLDLEGLAHHRGSIFGGYGAGEQPSQKAFETGIWAALETVDPVQPVFIEAESGLIGKRRIPAPLWAQMKTAPRIEIRASISDRVAFLMQSYTDVLQAPERIHAALDALTPQHGHPQIEAWKALVEAGDYEALVEALMVRHYDPAYDRFRRKQPITRLQGFDAPSLEEAGLARLAQQVLKACMTQ